MEFFAKEGKLYQNSKEIQLRGINWFGCETGSYSPHALWAQSLDTYIQILKNNGFNAVRMTLSAEVMLNLDGITVNSVDGSLNGGMDKYNAGHLLDTVVQKLKTAGILVMFNMHRMKPSEDISELWYTSEYPETKVIQAWQALTKRYINSQNVFMMDIKNEPHGGSVWGGSNPQVDWAAACERIGNAILSINPKLLICVAGVTKDIWGDDVSGAILRPVKLSVANKVVYSPHCYKHWRYPTVDGFDNTKYFDTIFGNLHKKKGCVIMGEYGYNDNDELDVKWVNELAAYMNNIGLTNSFYWCLNANGSGNQGILKEDWKTVNNTKMLLIKKVSPNPSMFTFTPNQLPTPAPPPQPKPQPKPQPQPQPQLAKVEIRVAQKSQWTDGSGAKFFQQEVTVINTTGSSINNIVLDIFDTSIESTYSATQEVNAVSFPDWLKANKLGPQQSWVFGFTGKNSMGRVNVRTIS